MTAKESDVQNALLRLSIMLATSIDTISTPVEPLQLSVPQLSDPRKIRKDLLTLIGLIKKNCTQFSLAVRPEKQGTNSTANTTSAAAALATSNSPLSGLSPSSLEAAKQQLQAITSDHLPKIVYLAQKARLEADVYAPTSTSEAPPQGKLDEVEELARRVGGMVMTAAQLGFAPSEVKGKGKALDRIGGHGRAWADGVRSTVSSVAEALIGLCDAAMDGRTREVMAKAANAREGRRNVSSAHASGQQQQLSPSQLRDRVMQATGIVWDACDAAERRIPEDAREALLRAYTTDLELAQDAQDELEEGIKAGERVAASFASSSVSDAAGGSDIAAAEAGEGRQQVLKDFDDFLDQQTMMTAERLVLAKKMLPLVRMGNMFERKLFSVLKQDKHREELEKLSLYPLQTRLARFGAATDTVVDMLLHGDGDGDSMEDEEEQDVDDGDDVELHNEQTLQAEVRDYVFNAEETLRLAMGLVPTAPQAEADPGKEEAKDDKGDEYGTELSALNRGATLSKAYLDELAMLQVYVDSLQKSFATLSREGAFTQVTGE